MPSTILLDPDTWDLTIDTSRNIAKAGEPYAQAQDAACACRLFQGELYYDTAPGIPYWQEILGHMPPVSLMRTYFVRAALRVPGVVSAQAYIATWKNRVVTGQVQTTNTSGQLGVSNF